MRWFQKGERHLVKQVNFFGGGGVFRYFCGKMATLFHSYKHNVLIRKFLKLSFGITSSMGMEDKSLTYYGTRRSPACFRR